MLDNAERERVGNPRRPEKPLIRLRVRNFSVWIALLWKVTVKIFKANSCVLYKDNIYNFLLYTGEYKLPSCNDSICLWYS